MKVGRASDIWSLGCILYQMIYGCTPFAHMHLMQKLMCIIDPKVRCGLPGRARSDWLPQASGFPSVW